MSVEDHAAALLNTLLGTDTRMHLEALISDWRKRGERIAELEREVADWYNRGVEEGHGY